MKRWLKEKVIIFFYIWLPSLLNKIKIRIWNKHVLLFWHRLWIRKDEFHHSLDMSGAVMLEMNKKERKKYISDLIHRREIAHRRGIDD